MVATGPDSALWLSIVFLRVVTGLSDVNAVDRLFFTHIPPSEKSYIYPTLPLPPVLPDESLLLPQEPPLYVLPVFKKEVSPSASYLHSAPSLPPLNDDTVVISAQSPPNDYLPPPNSDLQPPYLKIENMSCIHGTNFRATFKTLLSDMPVIEDGQEGCILPLTRNFYRIDLNNFNNMLKCGVRKCGMEQSASYRGESGVSEHNMCVVIRLPTVKGVRLPEDKTVTLMCIPQEKVVSQTRHIRLGKNKMQPQARRKFNHDVIATGGTKNELKTRIGIFRRQPGSTSFDLNVQADSVIELGEELLLKAIVNEGEGWKSSLIGPVLVTGLQSKKSALLVNQQGCINSAMKSICPRQPVRVNPLVTELTFRSFLFQESPYGEEMVVSVRTQGCMQAQDCLKTHPCTDEEANIRTKRSFIGPTDAAKNVSQGLENWEFQLYFSVQPMAKSRLFERDNRSDRNYFVFILCLFILMVGFSLLIVTLFRYRFFT